MTEQYREPTYTSQRPKQISLGVTNSGCDRGTQSAPKDPRPSSGCAGTHTHMVHTHTHKIMEITIPASAMQVFCGPGRIKHGGTM